MKITQEIAEQRYRESNLELLDTYINNTTKIKAKCVCNKVFLSKPGHIFTGGTRSCGCVKKQICSAGKLSQEEVEKRFKDKNLELLEQYKHKDVKVKTKCYCGKIFTVIPNCVFRGNTSSCGCLVKTFCSMKKYTQLQAEEKFKELGFSLIDLYIDSQTKVKTICHCNNIFFVRPYSIFGKQTTSCGCNFSKIRFESSKINIGDIFGELTVLSFDKREILSTKSTRLYWICQCTCGIIKSVFGGYLLCGDTRSCGNCKKYRNGQCVSYIQLALHKMINRGVVNFKTGKYWVDIALVINGKKIAIEYDSWKWHQNKVEKDKIRTQWLINNGWSVLSVKSDYKLPTELQLKNALDHISESFCNYYEIILSDWGVK